MITLLRNCLPLLTFVFLAFSYTPGASAESAACSSKSGSRQCLICNCIFETEGEPLEGKIAVATVVFARSKGQAEFPANTLCGTIWQKSQFSWTIGYLGRTRMMTQKQMSTPQFNQCVRVADSMLAHPPVTGPLWYHADHVKPGWAKNVKFVRKIGNHIFYTDPKQPIFSIPTTLPTTFLSSPFKPSGAKQ